MKIVSFSPGLGNQIFEFFFCEYLKIMHPDHSVYGYYNKRWLNKHNGLEVQKVFNVELPKSNLLSNTVVECLRLYRKLWKQTRLVSTDGFLYDHSIFYDGWWQDQKFLAASNMDISFRNRDLDENNLNVLGLINSSQSIFIHVRRGDYMAPSAVKIYGGICTVDYYADAIDKVRSKFDDPRFFVFSDDIEWARLNLPVEPEKSEFIHWNFGANSYIDMRLMSDCCAGIIANSTFSYWGAMLGGKKSLVIYPLKWVNSPQKVPDIFPETWIGI